MVRANSFIRMEAVMTGNGRRTKWTAMVPFITNHLKRHTRAIGEMISFKGSENFTTNIPALWIRISIIRTLTKLMSTGLATKVTLLKYRQFSWRFEIRKREVEIFKRLNLRRNIQRRHGVRIRHFLLQERTEGWGDLAWKLPCVDN